MSEDFKRQIRYIVLKNNDVSRALDADQHRELLALCALVSEHREVEGKLPMQAVVVESDWSIYEQVWALVQQEAEGASPQLSLYDRLANQVAGLKRELSEAKERIETIRKKARDDVLEEAHRWRKEILITQLQDACDIYIKHHKKPESDEPHNFVLWLPKELERREALAELKKELGI